MYDYKRTADAYYQRGDYYTASVYYDKYLSGKLSKVNKDNYQPYMLAASNSKTKKSQVKEYETTVYQLAESYRKYNDYSNAERWYGEATRFDTASFPLARYWYGISLRANKNYQTAALQFKQFLAGYNHQDQYSDNALKELANCTFIQQQYTDSAKRHPYIGKMKNTLNEGGANYAPGWLNASTFIFTSSRPDSVDVKSGKNPYVNHIYQAVLTDTGFGSVQRTVLEYPKDMQQGVASVYEGKKMYLTRWVNNVGSNVGAIYVSEYKAGGWSDPVKLNASVNVEGYSSMQPYITADNKYLIFSSNRPGGLGKYDLWYVMLDADGNVGPAINMGLSINSKEDEEAPFYHQGSKTLVFASTGRIGMGGFDLYKSTGDFSGWSEPENLGYPINSTKDDIYFTAKNSRYLLTDAYFSSDRNSVCCLELYSLKKANHIVTGKLFDCATKEPAIGAKISVIDPVKNDIIYKQTIDATAAYNFEMENFIPVKIVAENTGYVTKSTDINTPSDMSIDTLWNGDICLKHIDVPKPVPYVVGKPVVLKDIYYDFDKATLRPESYPTLDTLASVIRMYPNILVELSAHTDGKGTDAYNNKLSDARAKSCVDYLIKIGIPAERLSSKGYGKTRPVAPNKFPNGKDNPAGRQLNRRTEVTVMHY